MKQSGVSVIICCHNGANRLPETIRHIARQRVPSYIPWELVIIDNGSTDDSGQVARMEWQKHRLDTDLRIVRESALGLSFARARGFQEARYEFMLLCDDDNWLDEKYVSTVYEIMAGRSAIGALGGIGKLVCEGNEPSAELSRIFAAGEQAPASGRVPSNKVYGAGCAIRNSAYQKLLDAGFRSLLTDRRGAELSSGGDYELCLALAIAGYDIWYDERLHFIHFITRERLTWQYFMRYAYESSQCFNVLTSYKLVAGKTAISRFPVLAVLMNFVICCKFFISISAERMLNARPDLDKPLYFRHLMFKHKLRAYFRKSYEMMKIHREILNFQERSQPAQHILKPVLQKEYVPSFKLSFFSKPSRQLR